MVTDQAAIAQAIEQAAVKATMAAVQAMATDASEIILGLDVSLTRTGPKLDVPALKQPIFNWGSVNKCTELKN